MVNIILTVALFCPLKTSAQYDNRWVFVQGEHMFKYFGFEFVTLFHRGGITYHIFNRCHQHLSNINEIDNVYFDVAEKNRKIGLVTPP